MYPRAMVTYLFGFRNKHAGKASYAYEYSSKTLPGFVHNALIVLQERSRYPVQALKPASLLLKS